MVARLRNVTFRNDSDGWYPIIADAFAANQALGDVVAWLGFNDVDSYLDTLPRERHGIFQRATS